MTFCSQSPESVGIASKDVLTLLTTLEDAKIPMHSLLIYRHGALVTEGYYAPYKKETLHRLFSVTKSLVCVAIGELISRGHLCLSDPICDYFSDYVTKDTHPYIKSMTIEHLLKMETCHRATTYKHDASLNWVQSFFTTPPSHRPGSHFNYDTSSSHTLGALVKRISGKNVLDYLQETFLHGTDFSPDAYILNDPFGEAMGGSGLMARPIDLLIFAQKVMMERTDNPYLRDATSNLTSTLYQTNSIEEQQGYGYQFWQLRHEGYACFGMGGQYALCYPKHDLIVVTTADTQGLKEGNATIIKAVYDHIVRPLSQAPLPKNLSTYQQLCQRLNHLSIDHPVENCTQAFHNRYALATNTSGFHHVTLDIDPVKNQGILSFEQDQEVFDIPFGFDHGIVSTIARYHQRVFSYGHNLCTNQLHIKTHLIDACIGSIDFHLTFHKDKRLSIFIKKIEETLFHEFNGYFESI